MPIWQLPKRLAALVFLAALASLSAGQARAQSVDWILNLTDAGSDPTAAGGTILYNMTVTNDGTGPAGATTLTLTIPATTTFTGSTGTITGCAPVPATGPAAVVCTVPPLASGGVASLAASVLTTTSGSVDFGAAVPVAGDADPDNNVQTETTTVTAGADIALSLTGPATAASGSTITYTFTATNNGPDPASNLVLTFPIPTGIANVVPPPGCVLSAGAYVCTIAGPVPVGGSVSQSFLGQISPSGGSTITGIGSVGSATPFDPISDNNTATLSTSVTAGSDLSIAKDRAPSGPLLVGDDVTFTLTPQYTGDSPSAIVVRDTLPANYSVGTVTAPGWTCTVTGPLVECLRSAGSGPGANVPLGPITIDAVAVGAGSVANEAVISAGGPTDPVPGNNTASDGGVVISVPTVDFAAAKTGPIPALVVVGNSYSWQISTTNIGNAPFIGVVRMTDNLPAGLEATGYDLNGWTCLPAASTGSPVVGPAAITCERTYTVADPLPAGASPPAVQLFTVATAEGQITNSMTVSAPVANIADGNPGNDTVSVGVVGSTGGNSANIAVAKSASLASVPAGEVETFTIEVTNAGPQPSSSITLSDDLDLLINTAEGPTGAGLISVTVDPRAASGTSCLTTPNGLANRALSCSIATLPVCTPGVDCPVITVSVRPGGEAGPRTNVARAVSSVTADPDLTDNAGAANYAIEARADVTVTKTDSPDPVPAGQNLTYVITAQNLANGLSSAADVRITDTLPANVTFVSASPSSGSCTTAPAAGSTTGPGNSTLICALGDIANGAQQTVSVVVRPNLNTRGTQLANAVAITTATVETDTTNNAASALTDVVAPAVDLLINKDDSVDPLPIGDDTVYTVSVTNLGPSAAENVVMTDTMPGGPSNRLSYQSHVATGATCSSIPAVGSFGGTLECSYPVIPAGETRVITVTARGTAKGVGVNSASVRSDETALGFESNLANNQSIENTTVRTRADVEVASKVATPSSVNLREPFTYVITVRNNPGAGLAEADDVVVSDTLPAGMQLTGTPTVTVTSGSASTTTCTGASGGTSFTCSLGTLSSGGAVQISMPAIVTDISGRPQAVTNTASVVTSSLDVVPGNNSNSGDVSVQGSSIAGSVFRDFANDGALTAGTDSGIGGVTMTLTGTALDGTTITRTVQTAPDGTYRFDFLPEGTYSISQGTIAEGYLTDGTTAAGSTGGTVGSPTLITGIGLGPNEDATSYLFPKIPQARVAIAKQVATGPTINADGSFNVTFRLQVENPSLEGLTNVVVTDPLAGAAPAFGTNVTLGAPGSDPMAAGSYTMLSAPSGSCGGVQAGFNGGSATTAASGFTLAAGANCTIDISLRVQPTSPLPPVLAGGERYRNQATVTGEGALSGQTSATNPQLTDLSDNGATADPNGNGQGNETGENDPTPVAPAFVAAIDLEKAFDLTTLPSPVAPGAVVGFTFTVTNTGNVPLTNVTIGEALAGASVTGGPISLAPGATDTTTFRATYALTAADVAANAVTNTATATGTWTVDGSGNPVTVSDPDTLTTGFAAVAVVKTADASGLAVPPVPGNVITYRFAVTNTGGVALTNVRLTDPLPGITLSGGPIGSLPVGATDSATFTATYAITQADIDAGQVVNRATATGDYGVDGSGNPISVSDQSGATVDEDADTVVPLAPAPTIRLVKSLASVTDTTGDGIIGAGDTASYTFAVTNTGNVALAGVTVTDPLVVETGGPITLAIGETNAAAFTATYVLTQANVDAGFVQNTATATGGAVNAAGTPILGAGGAQLTATDVSDTGTNPDGTTVADPAGTETPDGSGVTDADPTNDPTVALVDPVPGIELIKRLVGLTDTNGDGLRNAGDTATYAFTVRNTGNVALAGVTITDPLVTMAGGPIPLLAVGGSDSATFSASYVVTQADVDRGYFDNSATTTGTAATSAGTPILDGAGAPIRVSDVSDTGTNPDGTTVASPATVETPTGGGVTDGDLVNDPTSLLLGPDARISLIKSLVAVTDTNGDGQANPGDVVTYSFAVRNTGNVALAGVTITDPLLTVAGGPINLAVGASDSGTFTGSYVLTQADIDRTYLQNTALASGAAVTGTGAPILGPGGVPVRASDTSDSGTAPDGSAVADPEATETPDGTGATDGDPANDPTVALLTPAAGIRLVKSLVSVTDTTGNGVIGAGDTATYAFAVTNTGNLRLAGVTVTDPLVTVSGGPITLEIGATNATAFTASYTLTQANVDAGFVQNTATTNGNAVTASGSPILGAGGAPITVSDVSDTGTNPDGSAVADPAGTETPDGSGAVDLDPGNDPTVALLNPAAGVRLIKRLAGTTDVNGNGFLDAGDILTYAFDVTNTGNLRLDNVTITDPIVAVTGGPTTLDVGETDSATFTASYVVTPANVTATYVENTAQVTGNAVTSTGAPVLDAGGNPVTVTDVSDTGTTPGGAAIADPEATETPNGAGATDGDPTNDPTVVLIGEPEIALDIAIDDIRDTNGNGIIDAGDVIVYSFTVTNTGTVPLTNVNMDPASLSLPLGLTCTPISLPIGATATLVCTGNTYTITPADAAAGTVTLSGTATGQSPSGLVVSADDAVASPVFLLGGLSISKTVDRSEVSLGDVVTYTITVTNQSTTLTTTTNVVDQLPAGFVYQGGTGTLGGAATEPVVAGRTLTWENVTLAPGASAVVTLKVRIGGSVQPGVHDNHARAINGAGLAVSADALASVRVGAEPVFSCSTVIGRVFEDPNQDGYFNDEPPESNAAITDQTYHADKYGGAPEVVDVGEKGIPGVRLIAPDGFSVTTDSHGRFSVPCAALPADIGSNFMLKLDTRTLPTGYRLTTENPRVVRLTQGMITKMNFGAAISRVVRVDLSRAAFGGTDGRGLRPELVAGLRAMVADIADTPAMVRISYQLGSGESEKLAKQRMRAVERALRELWPANGRYQLNVESVIRRKAVAGGDE